VKEALSGGGVNDVFFVDNDPAGKDVVTCGGGFDWVFANRKGMVTENCEKVGDRVSEFGQVGNSIPQSFWESLPYPFGPQYPSKPRDYAKAAGLARAFEKANTNPLAGDWRRKGTCEEYVRAHAGDKILSAAQATTQSNTPPSPNPVRWAPATLVSVAGGANLLLLRYCLRRMKNDV